jgi:hypothetical protein
VESADYTLIVLICFFCIHLFNDKATNSNYIGGVIKVVSSFL